MNSNTNAGGLEAYKNQQSVLVVINIAVLAALFVVHILFLFEIGPPSRLLLATLAARFVILILELAWIQRLGPEASPLKLRGYNWFSIWLNILFAFVASGFGGTADSHYSVLMIIPIIQAAYNYDLFRMLAIIVVAAVLTLFQVWVYFQWHPPIDYGEFFEAATVTLIFVVVGIVVKLLVGNLKEEEAKLTESLERLEQTQSKLVAEEKLAAVGQLSGAIAHEIRNPVAMIASSLELASKQPADSPLRSEMYEIATRESRRLEVLTGDFLAFARTKPPERRSEDVAETLDYVAGLVRARLAESGISIECGSAVQEEKSFDAAQLRQALLNLVLNAADAAGTGGTVRIGYGSGAFFIENNGPGIDSETAERMFEPFFTTRPKGTGLGLSIVRSIARAHGGDVVLAHNEDGRVRFELRIEEN